VPFLFDTDAISEALRKRPAAAYLEWLRALPRGEQFASAVSIGEMYRGAFRSPERERHLRNIEERVLSAVTVLPFDTSVARIYGELHAALSTAGRPLADADLQIAATGLRFGLEMVTGNLRHFSRIPGLVVNDILARARQR